MTSLRAAAVVGLMSGISADGVDAVLVRFGKGRGLALLAYAHL